MRLISYSILLGSGLIALGNMSEFPKVLILVHLAVLFIVGCLFLNELLNDYAKSNKEKSNEENSNEEKP